MYYEYSATAVSSERSTLSGVFMWMALALCITGGIAYYIFSVPDLIRFFFQEHPGVFFGVLLAQLGVAMLFSFMIYRLSYLAALALFVLYAVLTGVSLSSIFVVYTLYSITSTFFIAALMFGGMALYGYFTRADLSSMGSLFMMALWGMIIAMLINMFFKSEQFNYIISFLGVIIFAGLTAFDIQRIKQISATLLREGELQQKVQLMGAFTLYLDFINLFLSLLQLTGRRND